MDSRSWGPTAAVLAVLPAHISPGTARSPSQSWCHPTLAAAGHWALRSAKVLDTGMVDLLGKRAGGIKAAAGVRGREA